MVLFPIDITITTVIVLVAFTGLAILGIGESAFVAVIIFIIHLSTLSLLVIVSGWFLFTHGLQTFISTGVFRSLQEV
jgi:hypothetical protein